MKQLDPDAGPDITCLLPAENVANRVVIPSKHFVQHHKCPHFNSYPKCTNQYYTILMMDWTDSGIVGGKVLVASWCSEQMLTKRGALGSIFLAPTRQL